LPGVNGFFLRLIGVEFSGVSASKLRSVFEMQLQAEKNKKFKLKASQC
jgi:hypothetical protein